MKTWKGNDLKGLWSISFKIDGIQAIKTPEGWVSRAGKPLYNIPDFPAKVVEVYLGSWEKSMSACRTRGPKLIAEHDLFSLDPLDPWLVAEDIENPTKEEIEGWFKRAQNYGFEGLVLHGPTGPLKVKTKETHDVPVTGRKAGTGQFEGILGAFKTPRGWVGTGFTPEQRREFLNLPDGTIIEVECMSLTPKGKFRHPRFIRVREDRS